MRPGAITLTHPQALMLREAIRPLNLTPGSPIDPSYLIALAERILLCLVEFETSGIATYDLVLSREDVLLINQFVSAQDGDWAAGVLKQARRALYELRTGVLPGYTEATEAIWKGTQDDAGTVHD